jgi:hypothetical protein
MVTFPYEAGKSVEVEGENPAGVCAATWAASRPIMEARKVEACIFKVTVALCSANVELRSGEGWMMEMLSTQVRRLIALYSLNEGLIL